MNKLNTSDIFQHSPTPTSIVEAKSAGFKFIKVNSAYCRMTQRPESELIGKALFEAFPANPNEKKPSGPERLLESFQKVVETKKEDELDTIRYDIVLDDGKYKEVYWKVINTPIIDADGNVNFIINSANIITEQVVSQRINKMMLDNSEDSFVLIDKDLYVKNFNRRFSDNYQELFDKKVQIGQSILDLTIPERRKDLKGIYSRVLKGETIKSTLPIETKQGDFRYFDIRYKPALDEYDEIVGSFVSLIEKTSERQAQQKYRQVVEHSTNMFFKHDTDGVLTYVSPQSKHFLGYHPEESMRKWTDFITDHPINKIGETHTLKALETGETQPPYELQLKTGDDRIIWVEIHEAPIVEDGNVTGIVGSLTDITERKDYEEQLEKSLERYDYASKATRDAIYDWDIKNDNLHWGEGFKSLFGYETGDDLYPLKKWAENVHPSDLKHIQQELDKTLKDPTLNQVEYEYRFKKHNGDYAYVLENGYVIRNDNGVAVRMIGAFRDITESKHAEIQTALQHQVAQFFKNEDRLNPILNNLLHFLAEYEKFDMAEIWLVSATKTHQNLMATFARNKVGQNFYSHSAATKKSNMGEGLTGTAWKNNNIEIWDDLSEKTSFLRSKAAALSGLHSASALPLYYNEEVVGILVLGSQESAKVIRNKIRPYEILQEFLGAEIRRKQQEEEMLLLFESSPDILAIAAPNKKFVKVNPGFCDLLGYSEEEITSEIFENFIHPDDRDSTKKEYEETIIGNRRADNYINRWITKSGETRYISWRSSEVFGEDSFVFAFGRDVTDKKLAEQEIVETNKKLTTAQQISSLGYWELDLQTNDLYWTDEVFRIWGLEPTNEPLSFGFFRDSVHPDDLEAFDKQEELAISGKEELDIEHRIILPDGSIKWVHEIGKIITDEKGNKILFEGTVQDINAKKSAEIDLERALKEKTATLESIKDAFFAVDENWKVTYWNKEAENILYKPREEVIGKSLWTEFEDAKELEFYKQYHKAVEEQVTVNFEEYYPGVEKWFEVSAYPSENGLSVYFKDITERKNARKALEKLNKELEERAQELAASNAELEQFAYVASHDLQEPLRMITGFLSQLDKKYNDKLDEKAHQYIHFAVDGAQRMRQIILDLLNYSRLNQEKNKREKVDVNVIVNEVIALERSHIEESGAEIISDNLPVIYANKGPIKQVFQNLINNALKYHDPENAPRIKISGSETDTHWKFEVKDNGIGIKKDFQETIFQIFQRLHTHDHYSGTGIGLAISKKIVERHGGEIWLNSEEGKGSTFYFTISKV